MNGYVFDIEADNLYLESSTIWIIHCLSLDKSRSCTIYPFKDGFEKSREQFLAWHNSFEENPIVCSYNGLGYDHWMLWKYLKISFHVQHQGKDYLADSICTFIDLFCISQFIDPDRHSHSLKSYGEEFGDLKIEFKDFSQYSEQMEIYCKKDVEITLKVFNTLVKKMQILYESLYGESSKKYYMRGLRSLQKDYYLYSAQAFTGIFFDKSAAEKLLIEIANEMLAIEEEVLPKLPPRKLKKGEEDLYSMPAKPFKKDGRISSTMEKWLVKHNAEISETSPYQQVLAYGKKYKIESKKLLDIELPMEIKDGDDIKEWFKTQGWVPTMYNFKRDPDTGKPMRDSQGKVIFTSPKIQEAGKICPNLLEINGDLPKKIVKFLSLRNRQSVTKSWVENQRLNFDGRLSATITGYTPTFRVKHSNIVNLPKASPEVVKGVEIRSLFIVEDGMRYVSADAAALENRCVADYTYSFDSGKYASIILNGDSHSHSARAFFPEETKGFDPSSPDFSKDDPLFKPWRSKSKNGSYCLSYGGSASKLASTLGISESRGKIAYENYWNMNLGLKLFKEDVEKEWATIGKKKYILGKDGKILSARSKHLLVNLKAQNLGATIMTYALNSLDDCLGKLKLDKLGRPYYRYRNFVVRRVAAFHDQVDMEVQEEIAEEIGQLIVQKIKDAKNQLKLTLDLDGEYKVGKNAAEIH